MHMLTTYDDLANSIMDKLRLPYLHLDEEWDDLSAKVLEQVKSIARIESNYLNKIQSDAVNDFLNKVELPMLVGDFDDELYSIVWNCISES